ncbi:rhomboid family intramembrane serine protease [Streptomyces calidiresistens]|uniref:Rhomboid family intramembrane serine protease n=1 Tax=Streptomyces calidiresistens TaxID=1485586 RepID=A0A7W3T528_9ACTN|nr:rhomboid family intramembrane serine protease [Streptomyces calidiresistens]MBB0231093.1 rhomboid family intramembrane serine protease [Streptomyces calidiresistens]
MADQGPPEGPRGPGAERPGDPGSGLAVCYRHPERETGIRCTRCERPICPDCMVDASVGYHCPECVRAAEASTRGSRPRTLAGGTVQADPRLVTKILLALNLVVFIGVLGAGTPLVRDLAMLGYARAGAWDTTTIGVAAGEWYRLLTSAFLHQQFWHIGFNMLALWFLGPNLEAALGRARFLTLYLLSALAGSTLSYLLAAPNQLSLGASGAIFGLFGAMAVLLRRLRYDMRPILVLLVINLVITFLPGLNIAWQAHLGGLIAGAVIAWAMVHAPRERRAPVQYGTCAAVALVLVVACVVRTLQLVG